MYIFKMQLTGIKASESTHACTDEKNSSHENPWNNRYRNHKGPGGPHPVSAALCFEISWNVKCALIACHSNEISWSGIRLQGLMDTERVGGVKWAGFTLPNSPCALAVKLVWKQDLQQVSEQLKWEWIFRFLSLLFRELELQINASCGINGRRR